MPKKNLELNQFLSIRAKVFAEITSCLASTSGETIAHFFRAPSLNFFLVVDVVIVVSAVTMHLAKIWENNLSDSNFLGINMFVFPWFQTLVLVYIK